MDIIKQEYVLQISSTSLLEKYKNQSSMSILKQEHPMTYWFIENIEKLKNSPLL